MKINLFNLNKYLLNVIFGIIVLFQLTTLKLSLKFVLLSRFVNGLFTVFLFIFLIYTIFQFKFNKKVLIFYFFPATIIILGLLFNILRSSYNSVDSLGYLSQVLPWMTFLVIPYFVQKDIFKQIDYWEIFSKFMFYTTIFSLIEYFLALNGSMTLNSVETPNGDFLTGNVAIFHKLSDDTPHFRFYSCFMEPGTFAMYLLPVICHSFYTQKYIRLILFLIAFYFTFSLGGIISLIIMTILVLLKLNGIKKYLILVTFLFSGILYFSIFKDKLVEAYDEKGNSAIEREENISKTVINFSKILVNHPFGIPLKSETSDNQSNEYYLGTNFIPGVYLQSGGLIAFLGYTFFILFSIILSMFLYLFKNKINKTDLIFTISIISLFPFIFQRFTILESSIYAFLFSPYILYYLKEKNESK